MEDHQPVPQRIRLVPELFVFGEASIEACLAQAQED